MTIVTKNSLTLTNLKENAIDRTEISFWHGLSATKRPLGFYDCGVRDHQYGNEFNVTSGKTYTVRVIAKQTKGSIQLAGGIWYTAMTSGYAFDTYGPLTLVGEASEDGLGVYERKFVVASGKTKAKIFIQIEQGYDYNSNSTAWGIYDGQVFDENGQPLVTDQNNYGALASPMATPNGTYIWKRTITYYTDGTSNTIWEYSGVGKNGIAGKDGVGLKTTVITYAISSSGTVAPTSGWVSSVPSLVKGQYLWIKTDWTYTDNSSKTGYSVTYISIDGTNGTNGNGIKTTTITYAGSINGTTIPTSGWTSTIPTVEAGSYLWTKTVWTYTDNSSSTGYSVAKMGNDGTITHTAWSWSADGTDRFTLNYPNLNQLNGSRTYSKSNPYVLTGNSVDTYEHLRDVTANLKAGIYTLNAKTDGVWVNHGSTHNPNDNGACLWLVGTENGINIPLGNTVPQTINVPKDGTYCIRVNLYSDGTTNVSRKFWDFKLDSGSTATPWMPSSSEVKTSDYPSYIGTYLDKNVESSSDYKRYQWTIFKGQDSNAYTAYSWSADGTDRFSTTKPNLNLLDGTTKPFIMGYGIPNTTWDTTNQVSKISLPLTVSANEVLPRSTAQGTDFPYMYVSGTTYTQSIYISTDAPLTGTPIYFTWFTGKYGHNSSGVSNLVKVSNNVYQATSTITWSSSNSSEIGRNADIGNLTQVFDFTKGTFLQFYNPKLELGSIATPWMPSESEAQDQWQDAIPMYIGVGEKDSQNPSDYRWQLNPRYVQASADSGLSNKAGLDDLASVANTANDALVQAQNAVSNEDYTSWLEHDYQTTIDNLQDVSVQNQEDIKNVDDRTTIVEGFYGEMKVKWNFIDESFSFSEEGMFISNAQSKMSIQITSDKIVFWDNNVDVAFITGEVLNIQKGVFLESATIGNHLITKFSDDSPVTIIRYVGGIT